MKEENHFVGSVLKELEAFTNMDGVLRTIWTSPVARNSIESFYRRREERDSKGSGKYYFRTIIPAREG